MKIYRTWMLCALLGIYTLNLISQTKLYITDFGAKGDGTTDDTQAIQQAIDACEKTGGGTIVFPKDKTFICGPVELKGNIEYRLEEGSVWKAKGDEREYTKSAFKDNRGEGMLWIWAKDRSNISFTGNGSVDGNGVAFMGKELDDSYELKPLDDPRFDPRPHVITLIGIKNVSVKNITIREGAYWTLHLIGCENATIDSVKLHNNIKIRNGDGIDIDHSRHVVVRNCDIVSGDDCVCLKNRREWEEYGVCKDITVENCRMRSRSCAVKIGSENMDSICQVVVRNCEIWGSNRGLGIQNRDEGSVSDVTFENIRMECLLWSDVWWGKAEPIYVTSYPRADGNHKDANWRFPKGETQGRCGEVKNITFRNICAVSENGCFVGGEKVKDILLENIRINLKKSDKYEGGVFDKRPCKGEGFVKSEFTGLFIENSQSIDTVRFKTSTCKSNIQLAGVYMNYPTPVHNRLTTYATNTEVPVYISHYGRHGSRWLTDQERYDWIVKWFDNEKNLTPLGMEVKRKLDIIYNDAKGNAGLLTDIGRRQHTDIARRMAENYPEIFTNKSLTIDARASTAERCIQSMEAFCHELQSINPSAKIERKAREKDMKYIAYSSNEEEELIRTTKVSPEVSPDRLVNSLFINPDPSMDRIKFLVEMHTIASDMQDVGLNINLFDIFTYNEMNAIYEANCKRMWICNGLCKENKGVPQRSALSLWNDFTEKADKALKKNKPAASLRFGHDTCLYRLKSLLGIENENRNLDEILPMAANIQLVFYHSKHKDSFTVRVFYNEREVALPLQSTPEGGYDWDSVKKMVKKNLSQ